MGRSWVCRGVSYGRLTGAAVVFLAPSVAAWLGKDEQLPAAMRKHIQKKILLGLDLQGGLHLVYEVQVDKAVSDKADRLAADMEDKLKRDKKVKGVSTETGRNEIVVKFANPQETSRLDRDFLKE